MRLRQAAGLGALVTALYFLTANRLHVGTATWIAGAGSRPVLPRGLLSSVEEVSRLKLA